MTAASDAELVERVLRGDREAFAQVYDTYADRLHDFAYSMLRQREDAMDAVADAFVTTAERLDQLRDPERLRPWLYSIVRRECLRRLKQRSRTAYTDDDAMLDLPDQGAGPEAMAETTALQALVWDAAAGLNERDRAMLDLHLRQGLDGAELGEAMDMTADNAYVSLSRLRDQVERSIGALLVARTARHTCDDLDGVLGDWDGEYTPLVRKRVARHVDKCAACTRRRVALASPAALLAGVPAFAAPAMLRDRVLEDSRLVSALSARSGSGGGSLPPPSPGSSGRRRRRGAVLATVAAVVVALLGVGGAVAWQQDDDPVVVADDVLTAQPTSAAPTSSEPQPTQDGPTLTASPSGSPSGSPTASETPSDTPSETPSEAPSPSDSPSQTPVTPGQLTAAPSSLDLGGSGTRTLTLRNPGGRAVTFRITAADGWLSAIPASGTLAPGASREVTVAAQRAGLPEGASASGLAVRWDRGTTSIGVTASRAEPPVIGAPSVLRSTCGAGGRTVVLTVPVSDESGVDSASVHWVGPAQSGTTALGASGSGYAGAIGPFTVGGTVQLTVTATDSLGNTAKRSASISVDPCPQ